MNENGSKRREWVKTAAIVFLTILLILTFFSNTIQNYSLPEVATQYVQSGTITTKIRGSGTVESGDPYEVKVTETRKVSSVAVKVGDVVQQGDVLFYLADEESDELKAAQLALEEAKLNYEKALLTAEVTASDVAASEGTVSADAYRAQINALQQQLASLETAEDTWTAKVAEYTQIIADYDLQISITPSNTNDISAETTALEKATTALNNATNNQTAAQTTLTAANNKVTEIEAQIKLIQDDNSKTEELETLKTQLADAQAAVVTAQTAYNEATTAVANATLEQTKAQQALDAKKGNSGTIADLTAKQNEYKVYLNNAQKELTAATNAKTSKQEELTALVADIGSVYSLSTYQDAIDKAQETVDELTAKAIGATITADIAGTVSKINVTAGNTTSASEAVAELQPEGKGYTLSFSVTNEQAKRLAVGDVAELVNSWRYDDVMVTLASIKVDTSNPSANKLLTFDVTGASVTAGQTLNVSVGNKSANYDCIVPKSAIREDNNGKFILIVESKSSPLGNRYYASRVDVEVLASDDTQSAISGALEGYEYVITTSSAPIEAGQLVRLAEN